MAQQAPAPGMGKLSFDRSGRASRNLRSLQRNDPAVCEVLAMSGYAVVYSFAVESRAWEREDMEGGLFVVRRTCPPHFQLIVNNRLSTTNMVQALDDEFEFEVNDPYLIFRNADGIRGVWFSEQSDRDGVVRALDAILSGEPLRQPQPKPSPQEQQQRTPHGDESAMPALLQQMFLQGAQKPPAGGSAPMAVGRTQTPVQPAVPAASPALLSPAALSPSPAEAMPSPAANNLDGAAELSKQQMQEILLRLIHNDRFIDLLHSEYRSMMQKRRARHQVT